MATVGGGKSESIFLFYFILATIQKAIISRITNRAETETGHGDSRRGEKRVYFFILFYFPFLFSSSSAYCTVGKKQEEKSQNNWYTTTHAPSLPHLFSIILSVPCHVSVQTKGINDKLEKKKRIRNIT
eukprot:TRINITY_DN10074_c0_g1_i1.p1 TRINITY_DN10074_c0_g1~~TRINITY_DN10074_c0_g1_i1.p1  ORF type:complete len:128 (-),score=1.53 TRINITY_DN10074_c0_g1_i1:85-468(-)